MSSRGPEADPVVEHGWQVVDGEWHAIRPSKARLTEYPDRVVVVQVVCRTGKAAGRSGHLLAAIVIEDVTDPETWTLDTGTWRQPLFPRRRATGATLEDTVGRRLAGSDTTKAGRRALALETVVVTCRCGRSHGVNLGTLAKIARVRVDDGRADSRPERVDLDRVHVPQRGTSTT